MGTCESTTGPSNLCSRPRCVTKKFKLLSLTMGPECARPGSPEMTPPDVSSLPSWAVPSTRDTCPAWDRRRSTLANVDLLLSHAGHVSLVLGTAHDGREDTSGGVISGEPGLAHSGPVVNDKSLNFFVTHLGLEQRLLGPVVDSQVPC